MNNLDLLLTLAVLTLLVTLVLRPWKALGWLVSALYIAQLVALFELLPLAYGADPVTSALSLNLLGHELIWRFDALSWFFALITLGSGLASSLYMSGEWARHYREQGRSSGLLHIALAANVFSMLLLLASGDFLSLFIAWELVSWAGFLLMVLARSEERQAAISYITYATAGAMALLAGLALIHAWVGSFSYTDFINSVGGFTSGQVLTLILLFGSAFSVKMAILPFHLWQAQAYAMTPGPGTAFLGAISSRMGLYGIILVMVQLIGLSRSADIGLTAIPFNLNDLVAWIAVLTIILPTYTALKQTDARLLLTWHGIGQGGYMLLGVVTGHALGSAGGILHTFNYATYQAALIFAVYAVMMRTGTADLNRLGGLVARMPLTFLVMLLGIIGLAGLPPMNGFVSKWLIYRSLIDQGEPLLFVGTVIGTLGTVLSVFKLLHNTFLGQLRLEHEQISEAPWSMMIPMLLLSAIMLGTGIFPGPVLEWVAAVQTTVGLPAIAPHLGGVDYKGGGLDMIWIGIVLLYGIGIGALLFFLGNRSKRVHQLDNYAGGHFLTATTPYHYSDHFYAGLMRVIGGWYRGSFAWLETGIKALVDLLGTGTVGFYRNVHPNMLLLGTSVLLLAWVVL